MRSRVGELITMRMQLLAGCAVIALYLVVFSSAAMADYSVHPKSANIVKTLVEQYGLSRAEVLAVLQKAQTEQRIIDSMANAAEKTKTWSAYKKSFLVSARLEQGVKFARQYQSLLQQAEQKYGVPAHVITAVLGIETNYGGYTGKANVLNALATLAFEHPRRGAFFQSELIEYIALCAERNWQADQQLGSYAGAMGMAQFMPSNYRKLAVDGDGDGEVNLFTPADAIFSVANYLAHHGWIGQAPVAVAASYDHAKGIGDGVANSGLKPKHTLGDIQKAGVALAQDARLSSLSPETDALLVDFDDADGREIYVGFENFYVLSRYNPRAKYAMVVHLLSEQIREQIDTAADV